MKTFPPTGKNVFKDQKNGKPLTAKEFVELIKGMQIAYNKEKNWNDAGKAFSDFYQEKNMKDKKDA